MSLSQKVIESVGDLHLINEHGKVHIKQLADAVEPNEPYTKDQVDSLFENVRTDTDIVRTDIVTYINNGASTIKLLV